jgi:hypothetical protein
MAPMTLPKILLLLAIVWLVWTFLRKQNIIGGSKPAGTAPRPERPTDHPSERAIEDMVKCPKCGAYVPAKGGHDCPGA